MANVKGLHPDVQKALANVEREVAALGGSLRVNSGFRTREEQQKLYAKRHTNPYPVAKPGTSRHETGMALDLGVSGMSQADLAKIAGKHGLKWAGAKDQVHFDYVGADPNDFQAALQSVRGGKPPKRDSSWDGIIQAGYAGQQPQAAGGGEWDDVIAAGYEQPKPQPKGILERGRDYISNWWNSTVHGQGPGGESLHPTERIMGAFAPVVDAADFAAGGFASAFTGNPQGGLIKWGVIKPFNALGAAAGEAGRQVVGAGWGERFNPAEIWRKGVQGFNEEVSGANFITETLRGNPQLQQWIDAGGGDAWTKWADFTAGLVVGAKVPTPLAPVFKYGGKGIRLGTDLAAAGLDRFASRFEPGTRARMRAEGVSTAFKEITNATPEYRRVQQAAHSELLAHSMAQQRVTRIGNTIRNIGRKLSGKDATLHGDLLSYHPDPNIRAGANNPGYLPMQILLHGAEAGSEGAFFNHPHQVLDIAADLGLPVKPLAQAINEWKLLSEESGRRMVATKLMDDETFAANAGHWVRRIYRTNLQDTGAIEGLIADMVERGVDSTRANNLLMALQKVGSGGPPEVIGAGLKVKSNVAKSYERRLTDASERLEFLPDYNAFDQVAGSLLGQFKATAIHKVFEAMAGDEALSAANIILNHGKGRKLDFTQTPRIRGMVSEITEKIKLHQEQMTSRLEKQYAARTKWRDDQQATVSKLEKQFADNQAKQPVKPTHTQPNPAPATASISFAPSFKDTADVKVSKKFLGERLTQGARTAGQRIADILQARIDQKYAAALHEWQKENAAWRLKNSGLENSLNDARAELARRQGFLDETDASVEQWFQQAEQLERRHDLLRGAEPTDLHANDALSAVEQKLGKQVTDPATRDYWYSRWKEEWASRGVDIFDTKNFDAPIAPKGVPQQLVESIDQNIIPAIALDESISAPGNAYTRGTQPPGWELWEDKSGGRRYGAMEGRWGPEVVRRFVEDVIDPNRFNNPGKIGEFLKFATNHFRALKLYYNPGTRWGIEINSFWEAKATVNAAGVKFDPRAYIEGMKEYKRWIEGDGPVTPAVEAMLQGVREPGAGFMTGMTPGELPNFGKEGPLARFKEAQRQKFIEVQQFPKAGAANVLIKAGKSAQEAGMLAEQGFGARGGMGGIETHGVMQIAEGLNRYGVAIFTSYPLHSINRFLQLMAHRPDVLMTYPLVRHYLLNEAGPEAQARDDRKEVRPTMVPIPGFKNSRGEPMWIDVQNLVPHGGALQPLQFGGVWSPVQRAVEGYSRVRSYGAAPDVAMAEGARQLKNAVLPAILGSGPEALGKAMAGETRNPRSLEVETPLTALSRIANFPISSPENATDRARFLERETMPEREQFMNLYIERLSEERETPQNYSRWLRDVDASEAMRGQQIAQNYLRQLLTDKSIDHDRAKTMIRRQIDWILSLNKVIDEQYATLQPMQPTAEEITNAEEAY